MSYARACSRRRRPAVVAALVAVSLVALVGVLAIAVDGGMLLANRRRVQTAADAAALAAAVDLANNYAKNRGTDPSGTAAQSAVTTAAANGFTTANSTVTVNIPPKSGPFAGNTNGYVEVIIQFNQPRAFSNIWAKGNLVVTARAVARGQASTSSIGILLLNPSADGALSLSVHASVVVGGNATVMVDSSSSGAASVNSNASLQASEVDITGTPGLSTSGNGQVQGTVKSGVSPVADPLASLANPDPTSMPVQSRTTLQVNGNQTLNPGVYIGGIQIGDNASVTLNAGIYYLEGGGFSSSGNVTGSGVMLYNAPNSSSDTISFSDSGTVTLSPPTSGAYQGITIFQDRTSTAPITIDSTGSIDIQGTLYAAKANLSITGKGGGDDEGSGNTVGSQDILDSLTVSKHGSMQVGSSGGSSGSKYDIRLVE